MPKAKAPAVAGSVCINPSCCRTFPTKRGLTLHMMRNPVCAPVVRDMLLNHYQPKLPQPKHQPGTETTTLAAPPADATGNHDDTGSVPSSINFMPGDDTQDDTQDDIATSSNASTASAMDVSIPDALDFGQPLQAHHQELQPLVRPLEDFVFTQSTKIETDLLNLMLDIGAPLHVVSMLMQHYKPVSPQRKQQLHMTTAATTEQPASVAKNQDDTNSSSSGMEFYARG